MAAMDKSDVPGDELPHKETSFESKQFFSRRTRDASLFAFLASFLASFLAAFLASFLAAFLAACWAAAASRRSVVQHTAR